MKRINKYIGDPRFLEILNKFLKAGYIDPKTGDLVQPEIGTPQGGVLSPLLCNIVLHELDKYMADTEIKFSKGKTRKINPVYKSLANKRFSSIDPVEKLNLLIETRKTRRSLMADPNYRRLDLWKTKSGKSPCHLVSSALGALMTVQMYFLQFLLSLVASLSASRFIPVFS